MADVITLRPRSQVERCKLRRKSADACEHSSVVVDEENRTIECASCERILDPYEVLLYFAYLDEQLDYRMQRLDEQEKAERAKAEAQRTRLRCPYCETKGRRRRPVDCCDQAKHDERRRVASNTWRRQFRAQQIVAESDILARTCPHCSRVRAKSKPVTCCERGALDVLTVTEP